MNNTYYSSLLILVLALGTGAFFLYFLYINYRRYQLKKYAELPFPQAYSDILKNIPLYKQLSEKDQEQISRSILVFINTKDFIGISIELTDEIKVVVAFYACLLLLHLNISECYENLSTIIIYPDTVVFNRVSNNGGIYTKGEFLLEGQSSSDTVVLSWSDAKKDAYHLHRDNVVIHEFAHEIDFLDGISDGTPPMPYSKYHEWAQILSHDFNRLQEITLKNRNWGKYKLIGAYAATNEAEFFAVVTERYFESPEELKKYFPQLYSELEGFYKIHENIIKK